MRTTSFLLLLILCLALTASAQIIYSEGPIDGRDNAIPMTGPNLPNFLGTVQDVSNGFVAADSGAPDTFEFGEWIVNGLTPSSISYELGTTPFGADLGSGTVAQNTSTNHFLFTNNSYGFDVYDVTISITSGAMTAGNTYWVSLSNADDPAHSATEVWDIPNAGYGGPAICNFRQSGINFGNCGFGGESFTLSAGPPVPEPSSIMLFGSGILGLVGVLSRKLSN
jgi:hypothetical protein